MLNYLVRRILLGVLTLFFVTIIVYGLIRNIPGTPLTIYENSDPNRTIRGEDLEIMKKAFKLDLPWHIAYFHWLYDFVFKGSMGTSIRYRTPVMSVIGERIGPTLLLSVSSILLTYLISVPAGLYSTVRSGKADERAGSLVLYALYSLPTYVAALELLLLFYLRFKDTPWQLKPGMVSDNYADLSETAKFFDIAKHMILPLLCYTYGSFAYYSRFVKANMEEAIRQDYIRTARAKGVGPVSILINHAFRNTLIPFVTLLGLTLPGLLSGSIILEQIFNWPGLGRLFFESLSLRDYPVIMGLTLMFSVLTIIGQLLADILYTVVDPRVTHS
jgi:peptide/nickel transport system permease protein